MCDICPAKKHFPVYTISHLTGERLCLCLDCAENHAEPLYSIVHGVNNGALDNLPRWIKRQITFHTKGKYVPVRFLARVSPANLLPPPPPPPVVEVDEDAQQARELIRKMAAMCTPLPPPPKDRSLVSTIRARTRLAWGRLLRVFRSDRYVLPADAFSNPHVFPPS